MTAAVGPVVLLIEDDPGIGPGLVRVLTAQGYRTRLHTRAADALAHPLTEVDLVLLDLGLPDMDGLEVCAILHRRAPTLPVIVLTARGTETDMVVGLDTGAVDYLVKPFRLAELLARMRAHTRARARSSDSDETRNETGRRRREHGTGAAPPRSTEPGAQWPDADEPDITVGDVTVQVAARRVFLSGAEVKVRAKEFDLLLLLVQHAGRVVTRDMAMAEVWDENWNGSTKTLDVHIAALRQRLGESGATDSRISTLRGVGYRFENPGHAS